MRPIACSLPPGEFRARVEGFDTLARVALRSRRPIPGGTELAFEDAAGVRRRLTELIAAESACCPFLTMRLRTASDALVLVVTGPPEAAPVIEELFREHPTRKE